MAKKADKKSKATKSKAASKPVKAAKKAKATKPKKTVPASKPFEAEAKKPSLIEQPIDASDDLDHEPVWEHIERAPFAAMCDVLHSLSDAFSLNKNDGPSERFLAAWHTCLAIAGWPEEEFWLAYDSEDACPICGSSVDDEEDTLPPMKPVPNKLAN